MYQQVKLWALEFLSLKNQREPMIKLHNEVRIISWLPSMNKGLSYIYTIKHALKWNEN